MINPKICSKCKIEKQISEFGTASPTSDGYNSWCKQCVCDSSKRYRETPNGIYSSIKGRCKYNNSHPAYNRHPKNFDISKDEFIDWYNNEQKVCHYCDIPEELLHLIDDPQLNKTHRLSIDCVENDGGYVEGNLVLACNRCNFLKGEYFSYQEYMKLAQEFVKPKWKAIVTSVKEE